MPGHRFFVSPEKIADRNAVIDGDEAHHLRRVLRLGVGDEVRIFDGCGHEYLAEIVSLTNQTANLTIQRELENIVESRLQLTLVQGLIKGERFDLVIQKAVELGVAALRPLSTAHTDVQLSDTRAEKRLERWQRIALEATKQSGRRTLMKILPPIDYDDLIGELKSPVILFAERGGQPLNEIAAKLQRESLTAITAIVGSEGGWSEAELAAATNAGFYLATIGPRILRAETAGVTVVGLMQYLFGDLR